MRQYSDAESLYVVTRANQRRVLGPSNERVAWTEMRLGEMYSELGRYRDAEPLLTSAYDVLKRVSGE